MSEFMMLDNLSDSLTRTPLLPVLLNYVPPELIKASKTSIFKPPSRVPEKSGCIVLTEEDGIDIEMEIHDTIDQYQLNQEQAMVLRNFSQAVIRAPGWTQTSVDVPPVLLVHGVFGAGKSFLIAVLIVFIDNIINKARPLPREERSCRFLVASMTALLDLNYTKFVRVGSLKKVARRVLPYTAQSTSNRTAEEIKELQSILDDDSLSIKERQYVKDAMKRFQKLENRGIVEGANVVGATCIASTFEVLDGVSFPIVILDEARCHHRIAEISNALFYSNVLQTGATPDSRAPLIEGLPTLTFIDNAGQEIQNTRTKSFTNPAEIKLIVSFIQRLLSLNIPEANIGVISLYKSQADSIQTELSEQLKSSGLKGSVQISTVDAFQGSEKDVEVEQHAILSDSEDEVEHDREDEGQDDDDYDEPDEDHDGYGYAAGDNSHGRTAPKSTRPSATARTYMLYEADEDDSGQSNDEQESEVQTRWKTASYYGGGGLPQRTAYDQNLGVEGTHSASTSVAPSSAQPNQRHNGRFIPEQQPQDSAHLLSLEGLSQLEGAFDEDVVSSYPLPEKAPIVKKEPAPAEDDLEEEEEEVLWEDEGEDEGEDQDVRDNPIPGQCILVQDNAFSTTRHEPGHIGLPRTDQGDSRPVLGTAYESQRIEDLDVAGWSQLATLTAKELVGGGGSETLTRDSDDPSKEVLLFESGGNEDEDDISCLEVGDLDMI
ncbi:hypothetical protein BGZ58_004008 [Dissophora ornata]|nr:hypothetical protein BGZ58_004008 [Dissophora ornata]